MPTFLVVDTRHEYGWVFNIYVPIGLGVCALFILAIVGTALFYRRRPNPSRKHQAHALEGSYALLLTCVVAFLLYITYTAEHRIDTVSEHEHPAVTIDVTGARWTWTFQYPRYGITHRSGAGVINQPLVVPRGEPVRFRIVSDDVIHSFYIPEIDFKRDAMPHEAQTVILDFDQRGTFIGSCAEFCGLLHPEMYFKVRVISPGAFRAWTASGGRAAT